MKILTAQVYPEFDVEKNVQRMLDILSKYQADIYVFPELYLTGYMLRDDLPAYAINQDSSLIHEIAEHVHGKTLIFGFPETDKFIYNSAAIIHNGNVCVARKIYLPNFGPFEEKLYFKEGFSPVTCELEGIKIGVQICYDAFFPEIAKIQALSGADIIVNISASPITSRAMFEKIIPARAIENTVFMIYVNWAGLQRTMEFWGGSMIYTPRGNELYKAPYFKEDIHITTIDLNELKIARTLRPTLRDTKKEFYNI
ncbi:MAG: carbon-nitrogen hydrolase family protein [Euryarchaeota archaeon]|nr:carbon-nitrogen hydrolase family protein [Euryarchaeota archaeon]